MAWQAPELCHNWPDYMTQRLTVRINIGLYFPYLSVLLLLAGIASSRSAAVNGLQRLRSVHIPAAVARLAPVGTLPGSQNLKLAIGLPLRNEQQLDTLLQELYDPANPNYHHYLTTEEFTQRFGPTEADYQAAMSFAKSKGLTVTVTHPNRVLLDVEGTVTDIQKAFHLALRTYRHPLEGREFFAPDAEPSIDLGVPILNISGLDNYSLPRPISRIRPFSASAKATPNAGSGPSGSYRGSDFRTAYVPGTSLTGAGQTVGLLQFDGFYANDIATYASQAGLPSIPVTVVPVDGGVSTPGGGNSEVCLDIEMVMSMAPGVTNIYVYEAPNPSPWVDLLNAMATHNPLSKQLSCSWGGGSANATAENIFKQMAAQGQSFFNATGDSDAFTSAISFPSDSTNITEVGGTTLTTGSGPSYSSETVWNWGGGTGSSGGISTYYRIPSYQAGVSMAANQGSTTMRNVPDVALTADNVYVVYNNGGTGIFGGTSCAAPLWAGFTALVNQQAVAAGQSTVGFLNPALYTLGQSASYSTVFRDTTTGNNFSSSSPSKFSATAGYDLCTGWGTPNGINMINALAAPPVRMPLVTSNGFTLVAEGCPNGVVDPSETVTVNFSLVNRGTANTTNLVATLLSDGGIVSPSGPQTYGILATNGAAAVRSFTFTASGNCGGTNTASLRLQDGAANLGTVTFAFSLGQPSISTVFSQNFDGVIAPALPAGWATSASNGQSGWVASTATSSTAPNSVFSPDPATNGVNELDSPVIALPIGTNQLSFRNYYNLQSGRDGGVLEIKMGAGSWTDIVAAGGSFVGGGYNSTLSSRRNNPLGGRQAWSGNSSGFTNTVVNLPAAAAGQSIQLRWRCGTDSSTSGTGWYLDTVSIIGSSYACCTGGTDLGVSLAGSANPVLVGQNLSYTLTVANLGTAPAYSVMLTDALPAAVTFLSASPGCVNLGSSVVCSIGTLPGGGATNFMVIVKPTASGLITNALTVASSTADPNSANNTAAIVTTVNAPLTGVPIITSGNFALVAEGCTNGAIDPAETVTVNFGLQNTGTAATTNLVATLLATGGVLSPNGPQTYGVLTTNGTPVVQPFTFTAVGSCGGTNVASLHLQDGASDLGTVSFSFRLGSPGAVNVFSQSFDSVTAPALPAGWTSSASNAQSAWVTSISRSDTVPNSAFSPDPGSIGVNELDSPTITLPAAPAQLTFRHSYDLESTYDGGVLEIKIGGGSWIDILAAGGSFANRGYITNLSSLYGNPLGGRSAWTGTSGGFITTLVNLPAAASGQAIQLRWRCGADNGVSGTGWYIDSVSVTASSYVCCSASADLAVSLTAPPDPVIAGQNLTYTLTVTNLGPASASSVTFTDTFPAGVTFVSASPGCVNLGGKVVCNIGSMPNGNSTNFIVVMTPTAAGLITNSLAVASPTFDPNSGNNTAIIVTTVGVPPAITAQPNNQTAILGTHVTFRVATTGTAPLIYQWIFNGTKLAGATADTLLLTNVQPAQAGNYAVMITNIAGSITSAVASLTVLVPITISGASLASPAVSVSFPSETGISYLLEYKTRLDDPTWTPVSLAVAGTGGVMTLQDTNASAASRYYRLRNQ
jgi:uncharacterized repeat protein (TIGR01451 family)